MSRNASTFSYSAALRSPPIKVEQSVFFDNGKSLTKEEILSFFTTSLELPPDTIILEEIFASDIQYPIYGSDLNELELKALESGSINSVNNYRKPMNNNRGRSRGRGRGRTDGNSQSNADESSLSSPKEEKDIWALPTKDNLGSFDENGVFRIATDMGSIIEPTISNDTQSSEIESQILSNISTLLSPEKEIDVPKWLYKDPLGNIQGPFTNKEMKEWSDANYFPIDLMLKRITDPLFYTLGQLKLIEANPFSNVLDDPASNKAFLERLQVDKIAEMDRLKERELFFEKQRQRELLLEKQRAQEREIMEQRQRELMEQRQREIMEQRQRELMEQQQRELMEQRQQELLEQRKRELEKIQRDAVERQKFEHHLTQSKIESGWGTLESKDTLLDQMSSISFTNEKYAKANSSFSWNKPHASTITPLAALQAQELSEKKNEPKHIETSEMKKSLGWSSVVSPRSSFEALQNEEFRRREQDQQFQRIAKFHDIPQKTELPPWNKNIEACAKSLSEIQKEEAARALAESQKEVEKQAKLSAPKGVSWSAVASSNLSKASGIVIKGPQLGKPNVIKSVPKATKAPEFKKVPLISDEVGETDASSFWEADNTGPTPSSAVNIEDVSKEFMSWCNSELRNVPCDVPTFVSVLMGLKSESEILDFIRDVLGDAKIDFKAFGQEFIRKRAFEKGGESIMSTPKKMVHQQSASSLAAGEQSKKKKKGQKLSGSDLGFTLRK